MLVMIFHMPLNGKEKTKLKVTMKLFIDRNSV